MDGFGWGSNLSLIFVSQAEALQDRVESLMADCCRIRCVASAEELAVGMQEHLPDLLVLDLKLAGVNGVDLCKKLVSEPRLAAVPLVLLDHNQDDESELAGLSSGAIGYIVLPASDDIFKARLLGFLRLKYQVKMLSIEIDPLSGLTSRHRFDTFMEQAWALSRRRHLPIALILSDVDHMSSYNENYGLREGDSCIQRIGGILSSFSQRGSDLVARYQGATFACLSMDTSLEKAFLIADRLRARIASLGIEHKYSPTSEIVTMSFGVAACVPALNESSRRLIERAENGLYLAKASGRNRAMAEFMI